MTIFSPTIRPFTISTWSPARHPVSTFRGSKTPSPLATYTVFLTPESTTASTGTVIAGGRLTGISMSTNMSGLST